VDWHTALPSGASASFPSLDASFLVVSEIWSASSRCGDRLRERAPFTRSWALRISRCSLARRLQHQTNGFLFKVTNSVGLKPALAVPPLLQCSIASEQGPGAGRIERGELGWARGRLPDPQMRIAIAHKQRHCAGERVAAYQSKPRLIAARQEAVAWHDPAYILYVVQHKIPPSWFTGPILTTFVERWR
jgi:hypothetical protein